MVGLRVDPQNLDLCLVLEIGCTQLRDLILKHLSLVLNDLGFE